MDFATCLADILCQREDPEEDPSLDLLFDDHGARPGPSLSPRPERAAVVSLRALVRSFEDGESGLDTVSRGLWRLTASLQKAVLDCARQALRQPDRARYFEDSQAAYERGLVGLRFMLQAIELDEPGRLWDGMAAFEAAVQDVDQLVCLERRTYFQTA